MSADPAAARWLLARRARWQELEVAERALRPGSLSLADADELTRGYRSLGADLTRARGALPPGPLLHQLEALYRRLHERLSRPFEPFGPRLQRLYRDEVPAAMRRTLPQLQAVVGLLLLAAAAGWLLVWSYPEMAALFASEEMIEGVAAGELWTDQIMSVAPASLISAQIAANNISVTLAAYVLGVFYGLGTLYIVGMNGLMLGGVFALVARHGLAGELGRFITAHGPVELSIVCVAGAAGLRLGEALARPGLQTRAQAFAGAVRDSGRLMCVCVPALVLCGWIEGHISPDRRYDGWPRIVVGAASGLLLWAALFGRLWLRRAR